MYNGVPLKTLFVFAVVMMTAGCTTDTVTFFEGSSPINAVAINNATITPDGNVFKVTRGSAFNYSMDVHYDFRPADFLSPQVELAVYGGTLDASSNFVRSTTCAFRSQKLVTPTTQSGELHFTGSFTLPNTAACATSTYVGFEVATFSSTSTTSLDFYRYRYLIN